MKRKTILTVALAFSLASCSDDDSQEEVSSPPSASAGLSGLVVTDSPANPTTVADIRTSAQPGETVTFSGAVIGSHQVFMDERAVMIVGDPTKLTSCDRIPGDACETPWDVCCDDPDVITQSIVTVQVLGEDGKPLKQTLRGVGEMEELSSVVVTGEVAQGSTAENMLVNATQIFVQN